jgi:hypothetical protein
MCKNLELYNAVRTVPQEAKKKIEAGRLRGKTDINPMWRIKKLTEQFGPCGFGWYPEMLGQWLEQGNDGEVVANVRIHLYVKMGGEWSKPIEGIGGAMFISKEKGGLYTDDDAYKKAYTDAISVACKAIGMGGDVYWEKDPTKYSERQQEEQYQNDPSTAPKTNDKAEVVKPITMSELITDYGLENPAKTVAGLEGRFGKELKHFTDEETKQARAILDKKKAERDAAKRAQSNLSRIDDADLPFSMGG